MCFTWFTDKILQALDARAKVRVLVHEAFFIGGQNKEPHYFVKVINCSSETMFTITHMWIKDSSREIDIINQERPLPHKLEKSDVWETWFRKDIIEDQNNVFKNVRIELSNGKIYKSRKNEKVRPAGFIAK
ncbi:MAG TPA: hypothetical protein GX747_01175 [Tenericutes bacterium]|nr:hypothetical protein [Mycoplasmatota bacterium]